MQRQRVSCEIETKDLNIIQKNSCFEGLRAVTEICLSAGPNVHLFGLFIFYVLTHLRSYSFQTLNTRLYDKVTIRPRFSGTTLEIRHVLD
jgi:hypothetical protein